jgi:carboxypeptidase family protein
MIRNEERSGLVFTIAGGAILLVVLLGFLGFFHSPPSPPSGAVHATPRRLGGVAADVVDALTGRAVAETNVDVSGLDGVSDHWREPPDPERPRRFELKGLPADKEFTLEISASGHVSERRTARVAAGETTELGEIRLVPLVTIGGSVVDANDRPVADAEVVLTREGSDPAAEKPPALHGDANGAFRIENLAPGVWSVAARTAAGDRSDRPVTLDAARGGAAKAAVVEVFPTVAVRGRLKLAIGAAAPSEVRAGERAAPVAPDGSFTLDGLFAGPCTLSFKFTDGWRSAPERFAPDDSIDLDVERLVRVDAPPDRRPFGRSSEADPGRDVGSLLVRVVDEAGRPLAGAFVELDVTDSWRMTRATARNGETTLHGLEPGGAWGARAIYGSRQSFNAQPIRIEKEGNASPFVLHCLPVHALVVKVVAPGGTPASGVHVGVVVPTTYVPTVRVVNRDGRPDRDDAVYSDTDGGGAARFEFLPPPPWTIEIAASDAFAAWSSDSVAPDASGSATIQLAARAAKDGAKNEAKSDHR